MSEMPKFWKVNQETVKEADAVLQDRYGMLANIPMICKSKGCPFYQACYIPEEKRTKGERCPIEVATILKLFEKYMKQLQVEDDNIVDMSLIREMVDIEIQMVRADMKLAIDGDFVEQVIASVDQNGNPWYKPELNKAVDYKDRLRKERHRILDLLATTRKNQKAEALTDPSTMASLLLKKAQERLSEKQSKKGGDE